MIQVQSRVKRPEDFANIIVARKGTTPIRLSQVATVNDGAQEMTNMALYNGERTLVLTVQKAQDANTIEVVDGLMTTLKELRSQIPAGIRLEPVSDGSRQIRVAVDNVRRTLIEGALLTILIVFLFLNSWRSTVITGLTLPISLIGTFWFMSMFGFTINMITLMALSLCVGLLIDDAIVVRENIVRHIQMGKNAYNAAMNGTQEIGLAVLATTLSSLLAVGDSITVVWANTNGTTAYWPSTFQVDGSSITPKWQGGTAPTGGNASAIDLYSYTIVKTAATPTYTVFASQTQFK